MCCEMSLNRLGRRHAVGPWPLILFCCCVSGCNCHSGGARKLADQQNTPDAADIVRGFRRSGFRILSFDVDPQKKTFRFQDGHLSNNATSFRLEAVSALESDQLLLLVFSEDVRLESGRKPSQVIVLRDGEG